MSAVRDHVACQTSRLRMRACLPIPSFAKREAMKRGRALESEQDGLVRKEQDRICKRLMRASETLEQTFKRQKIA